MTPPAGGRGTPLTCTPMRAADSNSAPGFAIPPRACDSHFHVFEPGYPHVANPLYTFPDGTLDQYERLLAVLGVERAVLVQPTYYGEDNSVLLDALRRLGPRGRGVVRVPEDVADAELDRLHELGVRAIRLDLFARRSWPQPDLRAWIRAMAALTTPRGWHLQFYAPGTVVRDLLPFLADLEDTFVVDHMGYMLESDGLTDRDAQRLLDVLRHGSGWIKLSGPYRIAKGTPLASVAPLSRALVQARPDRLIWGSDWPHLPDGQRDTGELLGLLADWAPDESDRHRILVTGPEQLFFAT